jgi:hypothetical protein
MQFIGIDDQGIDDWAATMGPCFADVLPIVTARSGNCRFSDGALRQPAGMESRHQLDRFGRAMPVPGDQGFGGVDPEATALELVGGFVHHVGVVFGLVEQQGATIGGEAELDFALLGQSEQGFEAEFGVLEGGVQVDHGEVRLFLKSFARL